MANALDLCVLSDVISWLDLKPRALSTTQVTIPGAAYTHISITAIPVDGNGSGAVLAGVLSGGGLVAINITASGEGYTQAPMLVISGDGSGAVGVCYLAFDIFLGRLITSASAMFLNMTNRPNGILPVTLSERRNGNGNNVICPYWWPILSVASVTINNLPVPASPDGVAPGWINDARNIYLVAGGGFPTGPAPINTGNCFVGGFQNILLGYTYGWATEPFDIQQAVIELVGQKFKRRSHIDQDSQNLQGQIVSFSKKDIPPEVMTVVNQYKIKVIIE